MSTNSGHKRVDAYPYRYAGEVLRFDFVEVELNTGASQSIGDTLSIDLASQETWATGELTVEVSVTQHSLNRVFPSSTPYDGALVVVAYCPTTHHRFETVIEAPPLTEGTYSNTIDLEYDSIRGRVELTPLLVRTKRLKKQPSGHSGPPFAERVGRKLAHGISGQLDIDHILGGRSKNLPTIPRSFADAPFAADDGNMWYLHLTDPAKPKLFINSDHGFLQSFFEDEGQHSRGRIRQLVVDLQGTQILTQFVLRAAELYAIDGEMRFDWQDRMLTNVSSDVFGGKTPEEVNEMLEPGELSTTFNSITTTVQRRRAPHESLERVLDLKI